jgi:hypothetical protein
LFLHRGNRQLADCKPIADWPDAQSRSRDPAAVNYPVDPKDDCSGRTDNLGNSTFVQVRIPAAALAIVNSAFPKIQPNTSVNSRWVYFWVYLLYGKYYRIHSQWFTFGCESLPPIRSVESTAGAYHRPLLFLVGSLPFVENMHTGAQKGTEIQIQLTRKVTPKRPNRLKTVRRTCRATT